MEALGQSKRETADDSIATGASYTRREADRDNASRLRILRQRKLRRLGL
jgi:hypothetical protein